MSNQGKRVVLDCCCCCDDALIRSRRLAENSLCHASPYNHFFSVNPYGTLLSQTFTDSCRIFLNFRALRYLRYVADCDGVFPDLGVLWERAAIFGLTLLA